MILNDLIIDTRLIKDSTKVIVKGKHGTTCGNWYQDNIVEYLGCELESFEWKDNGSVYVSLKEENGEEETKCS